MIVGLLRLVEVNRQMFSSTKCKHFSYDVSPNLDSFIRIYELQHNQNCVDQEQRKILDMVSARNIMHEHVNPKSNTTATPFQVGLQQNVHSAYQRYKTNEIVVDFYTTGLTPALFLEK